MATKLSDAKPAAPKTAKKSAAPAKPAPAPKAAPKAAAPAVAPAVTPAQATETPNMPEMMVKPASHALKITALVPLVAKATGGKKKDLKEIVEAVLGELGSALSTGKELNLPPLGKARVNRQKGDLMVVRLKRGGAEKSGKKDVTEGVAEAED